MEEPMPAGSRHFFERPSWPHDDLLHAWWVVPEAVLAGEHPAHPPPALTRERLDLLLDAGVRTFVDLTTVQDPVLPYRHDLRVAAAARRVDVSALRFPVPDLGVVADERYDRVLSDIKWARRRGAVYVHCRGGVGRTSTVVGCLLADQGLDYDAVLDRLALLRRGTRKAHRPAPDTRSQRELLRRRTIRRSSV